MGSKSYLVIVSLFCLLLSYSVMFLFKEDIVKLLTIEDGVIEWIGALSFFFASIIFFYLFFRIDSGNKFFGFETKRNIFFLLLGIIFFLAFGEEISWGQRIFGMQTPDLLKEVNYKEEINIHNLKILWLGDVRIINMLFLLFWMIYCLIIPMLNLFSKNIFRFFRLINLPIVPISIGLLFFINELLFRIISNLNLFNDNNFHNVEFRESNFGFLFLMLAIYFLTENKNKIKGLYKRRVG